VWTEGEEVCGVSIKNISRDKIFNFFQKYKNEIILINMNVFLSRFINRHAQRKIVVTQNRAATAAEEEAAAGRPKILKFLSACQFESHFLRK
jgi:hypothetical protein